MPAGLNLDDKTKEILERVARTCPVERSLHPDLELDIAFNWQYLYINKRKKLIRKEKSKLIKK
jgi:hypothetical protein